MEDNTKCQIDYLVLIPANNSNKCRPGSFYPKVSGTNLEVHPEVYHKLSDMGIRSAIEIIRVVRAIPMNFSLIFLWSPIDTRNALAELLKVLRKVLPLKMLVKRPVNIKRPVPQGIGILLYEMENLVSNRKSN